jgi:hypothetical protein
MQEFLSKDPFTTGRLAIARLTTGEMSAETMLQWPQRARPEAKGVPFNHCHLERHGSPFSTPC